MAKAIDYEYITNKRHRPKSEYTTIEISSEVKDDLIPLRYALYEKSPILSWKKGVEGREYKYNYDMGKLVYDKKSNDTIINELIDNFDNKWLETYDYRFSCNLLNAVSFSLYEYHPKNLETFQQHQDRIEKAKRKKEIYEHNEAKWNELKSDYPKVFDENITVEEFENQINMEIFLNPPEEEIWN